MLLSLFLVNMIKFCIYDYKNKIEVNKTGAKIVSVLILENINGLQLLILLLLKIILL